MFGLAVPVAGNGDNTRDIEIRDNTFLGPPDNFCNQVVLVGFYPTNPNTIKNVVVEGNKIFSSGTAIEFEHVVGGSIQNNTITQVPPGTTAEQYCQGSSAPVLKNSSGVTVANNGT